ncbi:DUF4169 family protein [Pseudidiomarina halophila]
MGPQGKEKQAEENRVKFGRTKAEKEFGRKSTELETKRLDQSKLGSDEEE